MSTRGHRSAWASGARVVGAPRWTLPHNVWLVALFALVVACLPLQVAAAGAQAPDGHTAGTPQHSHSHSHGDRASDLAQQGLAVAESQLIADHSHMGVLRPMSHPGVDGVFTAVSSMNSLRMLTAVAAAAMAIVMVAAGTRLRARAPPIPRVWFGPARPGRMVIVELCVIRR
ncbi:MAG: hypothetical protein K0U84_06885 [Actinomycetia bacterium]|nr:hypothetical protein [Actinomycetes bacterium]